MVVIPVRYSEYFLTRDRTFEHFLTDQAPVGRHETYFDNNTADDSDDYVVTMEPDGVFIRDPRDKFDICFLFGAGRYSLKYNLSHNSCINPRSLKRGYYSFNLEEIGNNSPVESQSVILSDTSESKTEVSKHQVSLGVYRLLNSNMEIDLLADFSY